MGFYAKVSATIFLISFIPALGGIVNFMASSRTKATFFDTIGATIALVALISIAFCEIWGF